MEKVLRLTDGEALALRRIVDSAEVGVDGEQPGHPRVTLQDKVLDLLDPWRSWPLEVLPAEDSDWRTRLPDLTPTEVEAGEIIEAWTRRLGGGFHPDTAGSDYVGRDGPTFSPERAAEYDSDMERLHDLVSDPCELSLQMHPKFWNVPADATLVLDAAEVRALRSGLEFVCEEWEDMSRSPDDPLPGETTREEYAREAALMRGILDLLPKR